MYRHVSGNSALALGLVAASHRAGLRLFLGSYPITPASDILHELSRYKEHGVITFQAEDEIGAIGAALGASYAGALGATSTSGPGLSLKGETAGLAVMTELPLVIVDVQRGGPSTGLPTKTEQSDLLQSLFGRHGEAPLAVLAAPSPSDCFAVAYEAAQIALSCMVPVVVLTDGYLANGSEPWLVPDPASLPDIAVRFHTVPGVTPYERDPGTLARPWVVPGTPGLEHRIGGLVKQAGSGNVSYDPENHERMVLLRAEKVARIASSIPPASVDGPADGALLIVGWGSTYGAIHSAREDLAREGITVSHLHLRHLNPLPSNLGDVLARFQAILVPEMNLGQLSLLLRARFLRDVVSLTKVQGKPFKRSEIMQQARAILEKHS
jgi:2-oxoglutarate ferredoxin oxidoreductase subunit alpha